MIRALGDTAIYVAIALFTLAWIGFFLSRNEFELARLFLTGAMLMAVLMFLFAVAT